MNEALLYIGSALPFLWGVAHLFPTGAVVRDFGDISRDNRLILTMEWITEAILLIFTGVLVAVMTARYGADDPAAQTVFVASAVMLLVQAAMSSATGGRVNFIVYRLCAPVFALSAALILLGTLL